VATFSFYAYFTFSPKIPRLSIPKIAFAAYCPDTYFSYAFGILTVRFLVAASGSTAQPKIAIPVNLKNRPEISVTCPPKPCAKAESVSIL